MDGETLPDIFDPEYEELIESRAAAVCPKYKDDPLVMGYYYGFPLTWPPDADVIGRQIEIAFGYERADGRLVMSPARRFRVPVSQSFRGPPAPPRRTTASSETGSKTKPSRTSDAPTSRPQ